MDKMSRFRFDRFMEKKERRQIHRLKSSIIVVHAFENVECIALNELFNRQRDNLFK